MIVNPPLTITETQQGLLSHKFSAVDLVDSYLAQISQHDSKINAVITTIDERAYDKAKWVDKIIRDYGKKSLVDYPLLGVTVIHKDLFLTEGVRTTAGSKLLTDYIPAYSATAVKKIDAGGAILIGKANCDAWAHGSSGENSDFRPTANPWNLKFVSGGSSSGSAAAVAANYCLMATGTDTCGSIRLPASFCGLVGLKPTYGAVSRYGVIAMASSLDCVGPLARTVGDIEQIYNILQGQDSFDATVSDSQRQIPKRKLKLGVAKEFFAEGLDREVENEVLNAIDIFKKMGHQIVDVSLPSTRYGISVYYIIQPAEVSSNLARYDGIRFGHNRNEFSAEAKRRIMLGTYVLSKGYYDAYYKRAMRVRSLIIQEVDQVFQTVDALITPVSATPAFKLGEKTQEPLKMYLTDVYAATASLTGIPALAIPSGTSRSGLPLGFQLMAPKHSENILFKLGSDYHQHIQWKPSVAKL